MCPGDACARDYKLYKDCAHLLPRFHARPHVVAVPLRPSSVPFSTRGAGRARGGRPAARAARAGAPLCTPAPTGTPLTLHGRRETRFDSKSCLYVHASPHAGVVPAVIQRKKRERARPRSSLRFLIFSHSAALPHESSLRSTLSFAASVSSLMNHCSMLDAETKRPTGVVSETACRRNRARARLRVIRPR